MTDKRRPYDRQEWVKIATKWLHSPSSDNSMLYSSYIALKQDEPELAKLCLEESERLRRLILAQSRKKR